MRNQIDHVIANARHIRKIINIRSQRGANVGSDLYPVIEEVKSSIKRATTRPEISLPRRWNIDKRNEDETCRYECQ